MNWKNFQEVKPTENGFYLCAERYKYPGKDEFLYYVSEWFDSYGWYTDGNSPEVDFWCEIIYPVIH